MIVCPILLSVPAIVLGMMATREIDEHPGMEGRGQAQAGLITGIIGLVLWLLVIAIFVYITIIAVDAANDWNSDYYYYD